MNELMQKIMLMIDELDEGRVINNFIELTLYSDWSGHLTYLRNEYEKISFDDLTSVYELLVKEVEERKSKVMSELIEKRREFCCIAVTLDGKPAKITGAKNSYATVFLLSEPVFGIDFSWETVERVVNFDRNFRS